MNRKALLIWLFMALVIGGLMAACGEGQSRLVVGMRENHFPGHWQASYTKLIGTKTDRFQAKAGETLNLVVWEVALESDEAESVEVNLEQDGRYALRITGEDTSGGWDLAWNVR
jgi:hypothetical protein